MHEASRQAGCDPDTLSFLHTVRIVRRHLPFTPRFPPRRRRRMHELILIEIMAVPAERSRGRHNPRAVKRKMSSFPTKARAAPPPGQVFHYEEHIRIVTPTDSPVEQGSPPIAATNGPKRQQPGKASAPASQRPFWLEHVRSWRASSLSRTAYCERHSLSPGAFHQWVARSRQSFRKARSQPEKP